MKTFNEIMKIRDEPDNKPEVTKRKFQVKKTNNEKMQAFCEKQYTTYNRALLPKLSEEGLEIISFSELSEKEMDFLEEYFHKNIYPVLTPMAIDSSRPFPLIQNKTLNIAALIKSRNKDKKENHTGCDGNCAGCMSGCMTHTDNDKSH